MLLLFLTGISLIRTLKYPVIGDDETPLQVKVTPVCFIVYVAADSFGYLTETLTFIYKVIDKRGTNDLQKEIIYYFNYSEEPQETVYHGAKARVLLCGQETQSSATAANSSAKKAAALATNNASAILKEGSRICLKGWDFLILEEI